MKYRFQQCIGARLRKLSRITDSIYRKHLAEFDVTESQISILFALSNLGLIEQGAIGNLLALERSTVSRNVNLLVKKGWVTKSSDYRPEIELTDQGKKFVEKIAPIWERAMDEVIEKIGIEGLELIQKLEIGFE